MIVHFRSGRSVESTSWANWSEEWIKAMVTVLDAVNFGRATEMRFPGYGDPYGGGDRIEAYIIIRTAEVEFVELNAEEVALLNVEADRRKASIENLKPPASQEAQSDGDGIDT